ncbi:MAG: peptidylprolyl isomerase [Thermoplasmatota archaeon]
MASKEGGLPLVKMTTNRGDLILELFANDAPGTVANFTKLVSQGFYDGIYFHRVIPDFVVQGGCPHAKTKGDRRAGTGGPGYTIKCETKGNKRTHTKGALSMAHAGKDTGGSQFFIVLNEPNTKHLNGVHTVFGHVVEGLNIVDQIKPWDQMVKVQMMN